MSKSLFLMLCIVIGLLVLACSRPVDTNRNAAAPANASSPVPAGTTAANNTGATQVGIAECDSFITAYENCVSSKVPEAARAQMKNAVATWRTQWKKLADNPQTRGTLAAACKTQRDATAPQMKAYGCTF
jgi:hypothetical protein